MKIIDWVRPIEKIQSDPEQASLIECIKNDFQSIRESLFYGDQVIIRVSEGYRLEVFFIYEFGGYDIKKVTKDFRQIYKVNEAYGELVKKSNEVREKLKDNQEALEEFNDYFNRNIQFPLFQINFYRKTRITKSVSGIPYDFIRLYIEDVLESFGIKVDLKA